MRSTTIHDDMTRIAFAKKAGAHFAANPKHTSYTSGAIEPGEMLALRWGLGEDCVLVLEIGDAQPVIYGQAVSHSKEETP